MSSSEWGRRSGWRIDAIDGMFARWSRLSWLLAVFFVVAGAVSLGPGWWGRAVSGVGSAAVRHWLPVLLFGVGSAVLAASMVRTVHRRRWPGRVRRGRREPVAVWLPLSAHIGGLLLVAIGVAVGMGVLLWWALGGPPVGGLPSASSTGSGMGAPAWTVSNTFDAMKIVLSVVAGIGAVVALTVAYRKQDQGEAAEHREETKLFNERFGKAADQLGSEKAAVRLAGVYAMAGLADDWREGRQTCIDVLCAYVRMPWPDPAQQQSTDADAGIVQGDAAGETKAATRREIAEERQVRHAIIRMVRDRLRPVEPGDVERWHRHHFDFSGAEFHGGDLSRIEIPDQTTVDFSSATFPGGTVDFSSARFSGGTVTFRSAKFSGGTVTFGGAKFSGGTVTFGNAKFSAGMVYLGGATFSSGTVYLGGATFSGGTVDFGDATFSGGTVDFDGATFSSGTVAFGRATFSSGTVAFGRATFSGGTVDFSHVWDWSAPPTSLPADSPFISLPQVASERADPADAEP
ncbi:hypothetical protein KZZ52_49920 [Dactylosporangium sp. AC04546]|uniref:pentapeptide repeat-containing protein n=1 Tax=Dactylosporangium sp. AC04546 TaxID=2862460 RepID=UPI001EDEE823|nr:hypothetical protein [Dactylosporangium sp. AC04546]WVK82003.1 hypothetical protein KZZ52_49920 [Dactylosporangium sp. AC04546]